ncbi:hypothetical protein QBC46DRAFT_356451 [Diplogelasinospora grovesii]|uniref:Uncharacterized protein n=1 Tax=Diplogelasinospora grovesii TaxID=303347 RepID=A0AAN6S2M2_9PEZI|nr:hypothetical protein QBC46DRAFT_356451 [Diplogelasinospora grovesii]
MASNIISVYVGLWNDYSEAGIRQATLTLPLRWGNVLASGLALLVSVAGGATWVISAYILHQLRVRHHPDRKRPDALQLQVQTLLRNNATALSALVDSFWISRAWASTPYSSAGAVLPVAVVAGFIMVLFSLSSLFVSAIATQNQANVNVLARPGPDCGGWDLNWTRLYDPANDPGVIPQFDAQQAVVNDALGARTYASWFYSDKRPLAATNTMYPVQRLPYEARMEPCPYIRPDGTGRCLSNDTSTPNVSLTLDTGVIDSHVHLGMNARPDDRSNLRSVITCSPIDVSDLMQETPTDPGYVAFNMADFTNDTGTYTFAARPDLLGTSYEAGCSWWSGSQKAMFWPDKLYKGDDADITLCYVAQNSVRYFEPVYDPLFLANGSRSVVFGEGTPGATRIYYGNNYINAIACLQQVQFCNPANGACTPLSHPARAYNESIRLGFNENQWTAVKRSALLLGLTDVGTLGLGTLGAAGLLARESVLVEVNSFHFPPDQWKKEARLWFETRLALLQAHVVRFLGRIDLSNPSLYGRYLVYQPLDSLPEGPEKDAVYDGCYNQKITTTGQYQNFQFFPVMAVVVVCVLIILVSLSLEACVRIARQRWVSRSGTVRQLARDLDGQYWLLRMALEGTTGAGLWRRGGRKMDSDIPVVDQMFCVHPPGASDYQVDEFYKPNDPNHMYKIER